MRGKGNPIMTYVVHNCLQWPRECKSGEIYSSTNTGGVYRSVENHHYLLGVKGEWSPNIVESIYLSL